MIEGFFLSIAITVILVCLGVAIIGVYHVTRKPF
jgi:uncharacterized protein YneF (UPF0154 family)